MKALLLAALVGVVHVHHAPSHDSAAPFEAVLEAAVAAGLDFVVLTEHADADEPGPVPAIEHAGLHTAPNGRRVLVLVGAEFATRDGHLLGLDLAHGVPARGRSGRAVIADIHAQGGFAVVPHPYSHGGWRDWEADFDGLEVQNNASDFTRLYGPLLPARVLRFAFDAPGQLRNLWVRPTRELAKWDELLEAGRRVPGFSGADAHNNVSLLGWQLDPYAQMFSGPQMACPDASLQPDAIWSALRSGACSIRWAVYGPRAGEAVEVRFPSGRVELQLDGGERVLELRNPHFDPPLYSPP